MKIIVTGSLGYVSKPVTEELVKKGHEVTVITRDTGKQAAIEAIGAKTAVGSMDDLDFLIKTFKGADAVYCMLAPHINFGDPDNDADAVIKQADKVANNYVKAINESGVKRAVYLSSIGAHMQKGAGLITIHHQAENTLNKLPSEVNVSFLRPSGFYKNLFVFLPSVKKQNMILARYGGNDMNVFVSNLDIADAVVEELESQQLGRKIRYVASEELTCNEAATIIGAAVGKPDLQWNSISDDEQLQIYKARGMSESLALQYVEMNDSIHSGKFFEDYYHHKPAFGKVKLKEFAKNFAAVYHQQ